MKIRYVSYKNSINKLTFNIKLEKLIKNWLQREDILCLAIDHTQLYISKWWSDILSYLI